MTELPDAAKEGARDVWSALRPYVLTVLGIALGIALHWTCSQR